MNNIEIFVKAIEEYSNKDIKSLSNYKIAVDIATHPDLIVTDAEEFIFSINIDSNDAAINHPTYQRFINAVVKLMNNYYLQLVEDFGKEKAVKCLTGAMKKMSFTFKI